MIYNQILDPTVFSRAFLFHPSHYKEQYMHVRFHSTNVYACTAVKYSD